jgi:tetratricopeptide (TPR) repeat protein
MTRFIDEEEVDPRETPEPRAPADPGGFLLHWLVAVPWMMVHEVTAFVVDYLRCRPWFFLPMAGPAILGLLLALYVTAWLRAVPESDVVAMLDKHVAKAQADRDWARVRVGLQAILERKTDSQRHQFAFAQLLFEQGDFRSAAAMIARLAPLDRAGYPPAHRLLAEDALVRYGNAGPADDRPLLLKTALHHLQIGGPAEDPRTDYRLGILHADRGDMALAELHLKQAAAGGYSAADLVLSELERQRGNAAAAERHRQAASEGLGRYVQEHPDDLEARLAWGRCLVDGGEWAALDSLLDFLRREASERRFRNRLGQLHLSAAEEYPRETQPMRRTAAAYAQHAFDLLESPSAAVWALLKLADSPDVVDRDCLLGLEKWYQQAPPEQLGQVNRLMIGARLAEALGDLKQAEARYQAAAELEPLAFPELAGFYRRRGDADHLAKTNAAIIEHFEGQRKQSPRDARASIVLAQAYAGQRRWAEARTVLAAAPQNGDVRAALAALCVDEFDASSSPRDGAPAPTASLANAAPPPVRGAADFELLLQALQAMPGYPPAVQRFRSGLLDASEAEARRTQDFVTRQLAAGQQPAVMHYLLAVRASAMQRWGEAIQHLEQAQRLRPLDVTIQYQLARTLLRSPTSNETLERSAALIQTALRRWPDHPELLVTSGEVRLRQGDVGGAVSDLEKVIARLSSPAVAHRLLAEAYQRLGNEELSQRHRELAAQNEQAKPQGVAENAH